MWLKSSPPTDEKDMIPLLRPRSGGSVTATLTGEPMRCFIHFAAGHSWPCTSHRCVLCEKGLSKRFYAYYPVTGRDGGQAILELTAQVETQLISQMEEFTQVPCGQVLVTRPPGKRNMPCTIKWKKPDEHLQSGGEPLTETELKAALMRIWNLPRMNGTMEENEYLEHLNETIRLRTNNRKT